MKKVGVAIITILMLAAVPVWAKHKKPTVVDPPTLTGDCASSTLVTGSTDLIGKIIVDPVNLWGGTQTCTLLFAAACTNGRVCFGDDETAGGGFPLFMGCRESDSTHVVCATNNGESGNDVMAYQCTCF